MTQDEIRKLLGGYAADTLTEEERRMLFEAALEDQELFNAVQREEELRELLADPVTRSQLRAALNPRPRSFAWRRWIFGVAVPAAVAVVAVVLMNRAHAPKLVAMKPTAPQTVPEAPPPAALQQEAPAAKKQARVAERAARRPGSAGTAPTAAAPAPSPEAVARLESRPLAAPAIANFRSVAPPRNIPDTVRQQISAALTSSAPLYQGPLLRYSVMQSGREDHAVRLEVMPAIVGFVALYEVDAAGNAKRVYPAGEEAARVLPNVALQIPADPISIAAGSHLRLVLIPAPLPSPVLTGAEGTLKSPVQLTPMVVDIPAAP